MAQIFAFREDRLGFHFELGEKAVLGRAPECDLIIFDRSASRHHAEIFKVDDKYYVADLGSTNGTLVNEESIALQTRLEPYDSIKIGQELFIFEPGLSVVVGPAPSALIIESLAEQVTKLVTAPAAEAAAAVDPADLPALMTLSHRLAACLGGEETETLILKYLQERFGQTFMSILWPSRPPARRLISLLTSDDDRRLLLSHNPFIRATRDREVILWPSSITELSFHDGKRDVVQAGHPSLAGPLYGPDGTTGLMYLENHHQTFTTNDLRTFAALLGLISPALSALADNHIHLAKPDYSQGQEMVLASNDNKVKAVFSTAAQAAESKKSILLSGETGTGKSALVSYIHNASPRKSGRLVTVNLSTMPPADIEANLFGQAPAPGGDPGRTGLLELADSGTLFLKHVEYLPPAVQKLLLMVIEEGIFFSLGGQRPQAVDLRVISSTSVDLWSRVEAGYFREDLYVRLNNLNISLPPLRDIKVDLENQLAHFMGQAARDLGLTLTGVDPGAVECLRAYSWPGNLVELKNEAALMVLFSRNGRVALEDLPVHLRLAPDSFASDDIDLVAPTVREAERHQLIAAMSRCGGELEAVAELLNQRPEIVILKMRALGLDPIDYQGPIQTNVPKGPGRTSVPSL